MSENSFDISSSKHIHPLAAVDREIGDKRYW
jgi:hypothetical protein